jgi:glycosyltransferase involved in cell wall biosynthesis
MPNPKSMVATMLEYLHPPLNGKQTGWPWVASHASEEASNEPVAWPRITVVTPSYNQGQFLEATIRSVLLQGYPNLNYLVMDGGSEDKSVEVIRAYERYLDYWQSARDQGQSDAINQGFAKGDGQILAWLNSDDMYLPGTLRRIGRAFADPQVDVVSGHVQFVDQDGGYEHRQFRAEPVRFTDLVRLRSFAAPQQSTFWRRRVWERSGPLDLELHLTMDFAYWLRMARDQVNWYMVDDDLALFRHHGEQKTANISGDLRILNEKRLVLEFLKADHCVPTDWRADLTAGLREIWVKEWKLKYQQASPRPFFPAYWLSAPFLNPTCLSVRAYYGALARWLLHKPLTLGA